MVEDWSVQQSYDEYFRQCSPISCIYLKTIRPNFLEVLKTIIGLLGGLCTILLIVIPLIVGFIRQTFWPMPHTDVIPSPPPPRISLMKRLTQQILPKFKQILFELNLFKIETNDNNAEREVRYQQIITRVYIVSLITSGTRLSVRAIKIWFFAAQNNEERLKTHVTAILLIITFSTLGLIYILSSVSVTNQISNPSSKTYENLLIQHSNTLQCPCSRMSIKYKSFMNLSVLNRHQVCSSDFIKDKWIETLLLPNLQSTYSPTEFQTSAIGFFQLLASFCQFTEQYLTDELSALTNKSLIHSQVVSPLQLNIQIQSIIKQFQVDTSNSFLNILELIRVMITDNTLISLFQSNWKWTDLIFVDTSHWGKILHTKPVVYNGTCNCGLSSQCLQEISAMPGLNVGCYPLEALLKSNLQCLYNHSCIRLIQSIDQSFTPLNASLTSKYKLNSSVQSILNELMVEEWISNVSYEDYYNVCSPSFCSYSYMIRRSFLDILSVLLGLYGGLVIITTTLVTILVHIWQQRHTRVQTF
ncbi:unnamed protein product [Rotaria sordida]|uniref:Uncharacterized protein n=1 Tax=Rotaria sordida TaxID=392033 RepID=A0A815V460_9BILA|nr:unnamed protein product [Rotaria sordida]CAF1527670.1 unnamed protein product [Rotaria sordida]